MGLAGPAGKAMPAAALAPAPATASVDAAELESRVRAMYRAVAEEPAGRYHFETGRGLAERLGYPAALLDEIPQGATESFAGVGYFLDLAELREGEEVLDLGSGSGMDAFAAAIEVGERGRVVGIDMTPEQLAKAERLRVEAGFEHVSFTAGRIEALPFDDGSFDVVISNGVINLAPDKAAVFREAVRVLRPGGRLAIADIVTQVQLTDAVCNADLWASCIGGATQVDSYQAAIGAAGLRVERMERNPYEFLSGQARRASLSYGVMSISLLARREG
jgi:arsenite methyltransferase